MSDMHVYVTGASGFVGTAIADALLIQGAKVTGQSRRPERQRVKAGLTWVRGPGELDSPVDLLINLAGKPLLTRWTQAAKKQIRDSRIELTRRLVSDFGKVPQFAPKRVLSGSAIGYYPTGLAVRNEDFAPGEGFAAALCRDWEHAAREFESLGSEVCCLRLGVVLSPQGGALKAMLPAFRFGLGGRLGSGEQMFSWISLNDLVDIVLWTNDQTHLPPAINCTAPTPLTNQTFTAELADQLSRPAVLPAPAGMLKLLLGEGAEGFLLADLEVHPAYLSHQYVFHHPDFQSFLQHHF